MERTPDKLNQLLVSVGLIADWVDVEIRTVDKLAKAGIIPRIARGQYALRDCIRAFTRYQREQIQKLKTGPDEKLEDAERRFAVARANREERRNASEAGEVITVKDAVHEFESVLIAVRGILQSLARGIGSRMPNPELRKKVESLIDESITHALNELAISDRFTCDQKTPADADPEVSETVQAGRKANRRPVGRQVQATKQGIKRRARRVAHKPDAISPGADAKADRPVS
jgi:phage terminase Nu1 subunit (DNA packaging protein)